VSDTYHAFFFVNFKLERTGKAGGIMQTSAPTENISQLFLKESRLLSRHR
jgi:hypothetical protein